jgi:predicted transcriptional regulator
MNIQGARRHFWPDGINHRRISTDYKKQQSRMDIAHYVTQIVTAYIGCNKVAADQLPHLIEAVHDALCRHVLRRPPDGTLARSASSAPRRPAVPISGSVQPNYLVCLEDGKRMKSLKRHLHAAHGLSLDRYADRWGLPKDYPTVAPNYSVLRSRLAKGTGLGSAPRKRQAS